VTSEVDAAIETLAHMLPAAAPVPVLGAQYDLGLAWPHFAVGRGGLGLAVEHSREVRTRLRTMGMPVTRAGFVGLHQASALIHDVGSEQDKDRYLRRIFTGEDQWCQLFSEPGAGSDLANVSTSAELQGDAWALNGQKVWTSNARHANLALVLARTDPVVTKHQGMTMFIMDMHAPGVEVRPLRQADGGARFSEVFLDNVLTPDSMRLGMPGQGWGLSMHILGTERGGASDVFVVPVDGLLDQWRRRRHLNAPALRDDVTRMWIESIVIRLNSERQQALGDSREAALLSAVAKVATSEYTQRLSSVLAVVLGPEMLVHADYDTALAEDLSPDSAAAKDFATLSPHRLAIRSRAMSIEGGTNEISRNIIGERTLGLPGDVRVDKGRPWRDVARA
jgi:alkylation response protein AidB-like acyl-CoA dehydrogenase